MVSPPPPYPCYEMGPGYGSYTASDKLHEVDVSALCYRAGSICCLCERNLWNAKSLNFPGLVQNHDSWSHITTYRTLLKKALELKSKFSGSKLKQGPFKDETFEIQDYIHQMNLNVMLARTLIRSPTWSGARHMPHSGRVLISTVTRMLSNISRKSSKSVRAWTRRLSDWPWLWSKQVNWLFLRGWPVERTGVTRLTGLQHIRTVWSVCVL